MNTFRTRLHELRTEYKLSAVELGKILKVSDSTIIRWESGQMIPGIDKLYAIAIYFKVSADYLIGLEQ